MATLIQLKRKIPSSSWNGILSEGEPLFDMANNQFFIGDGIHVLSDLSPISAHHAVDADNVLSSIKSVAITDIFVAGSTTGTITSVVKESLKANALKVSASIGSNDTPVYIDANGVPQLALKYSGATKITYNGTDAGGTTASFYAPSNGGTAGQVLLSGGTNAPSWSSTVSSLTITSLNSIGFSANSSRIAITSNYSGADEQLTLTGNIGLTNTTDSKKTLTFDSDITLSGNSYALTLNSNVVLSSTQLLPAPGTANYLLQTNGTGNNPTWTDALTISSVNNLTFSATSTSFTIGSSVSGANESLQITDSVTLNDSSLIKTYIESANQQITISSNESGAQDNLAFSGVSDLNIDGYFDIDGSSSSSSRSKITLGANSSLIANDNAKITLNSASEISCYGKVLLSGPQNLGEQGAIHLADGTDIALNRGATLTLYQDAEFKCYNSVKITGSASGSSQFAIESGTHNLTCIGKTQLSSILDGVSDGILLKSLMTSATDQLFISDNCNLNKANVNKTDIVSTSQSITITDALSTGTITHTLDIAGTCSLANGVSVNNSSIASSTLNSVTIGDTPSISGAPAKLTMSGNVSGIDAQFDSDVEIDGSGHKLSLGSDCTLGMSQLINVYPDETTYTFGESQSGSAFVSDMTNGTFMIYVGLLSHYGVWGTFVIPARSSGSSQSICLGHTVLSTMPTSNPILIFLNITKSIVSGEIVYDATISSSESAPISTVTLYRIFKNS